MYNIIELLKKIPHDTPYHKESIGDHIEMCTKNSPTHLKKVAFLHDLGKPYVKEGGEYIGHEGVSLWLAAPYNPSLTDLLVVKYHMQAHKDWRPLQKRVSYEEAKLIMEFVSIDSRSRISDKQASSDMPPFPPKSQWRDKRPRPNPDKPPVYIMMGLPGVGKSTYIKEHLPAMPIVSRDDIIEQVGQGDSYNEKYRNCVDSGLMKVVDEMFRDEIRKLAKTPIPFIIDTTCASKKMQNYLIATLNHNHHVQFVWLLDTIEHIHERNRKREGKQVPYEALLHKAKIFSIPPTSFEIQIINLYKEAML